MKLACFHILLFVAATVSAFAQGSLTPPGAPGATMKRLGQVEPRTAISAAGFVITNAGSYYVTTNIVAGSSDGIVMQSDGVTVDLNGFTLLGPGARMGIWVSGARSNIVVRGGTIGRWQAGVVAANSYWSVFEGLQIWQKNF